MKVLVAIALLVTSMLPAEALTRVRVTREVQHPQLLAAVAVFPVMFAIIDYHLCDFVAGSVAPDWPADRQRLALGNCPPRATPR